MYEGSQIEDRTGTVSNKDGKAWCVECGRRTKYYISSAFILNETWCLCSPYMRLNARCGICGKEVIIPEIEKANEQALKLGGR